MSMKLTLEVASRYLEKAQAKAREMGVSMSFAVLDAAGHLVALHRMDKAPWLSAEIAQGKAYTSAAFRAPSHSIAERLGALPMFTTAITVTTHGRFMPQMGGLPIKFGDELVGAIGASGGTGEQDLQVIQEAIEV